MTGVFHFVERLPILLRASRTWSLALVLWATGVLAVQADTQAPAPDPEAGRSAYAQQCARCHGINGQGDGVDAKRFYPRPRDLTSGKYKFRSTASGTPPTDQDLFDTVNHGLPGSNMPDWQHLDEATRWQLVYYLKSLSPVFTELQPEPLKGAADPPPDHLDVAKGKTVYQQMGCAACHGPSGRANGTSASGLVDEWNMPIRPANLTQGWAYRGGSETRAVRLRILGGIDGSGMPAYADAMSPEDAWHLAAYVISLQEPAHWRFVAHAHQLPENLKAALPASPDDPRWAEAERTDVRLRNAVEPDGTWAQPPTVRAISVQVLTNADAVAIKLTWDDPTEERQAPVDGLAVLFKPTGTEGDTVTLQAWPYLGSPALDACYWAANAEQAHEAIINAFEPLRASGAGAGTLNAAATYEDGRWQVVLQRPKRPSSPARAAVLAEGQFTSIAFVVWDGGNPQTRAISAWTDIDWRTSAPHRAH